MRRAASQKVVWMAIAVLALAGAARSATLADYSERLRLADAAVSDLRNSLSSGMIADESEDRLLGILQNSLPESEKIEVAGTDIVTDYQWLYSDIERFRKTTDRAQRIEILDVMASSLSAIRESVDELEAAESASPTKDADKDSLQKILEREEYKRTEPRESPLTALMRRLIEWLFDRYPTPAQQPDLQGLPNLASVLTVLLFLLVAGVLGFIVYKLVPHFKRDAKRTASKRSRVILGELIDEDKSSGDLFAEAEALARSGELTLAIRKAYIAALCSLDDRRLLKLVRHKTNRDYLFEIRKKREIAAHMTVITQEFEKHWYGAKESTEADWERVADLYHRTLERAEGAV